MTARPPRLFGGTKEVSIVPRPDRSIVRSPLEMGGMTASTASTSRASSTRCGSTTWPARPTRLGPTLMTPVVPGTSDTEPPSVPGTLTATAASSSDVELSWGQASDNVGVAGYEVFRCGGAVCTDFSRVAQVEGTSTGYTDKGVAAGSTYSYRVRAVDAAGNSGAFSNSADVTTPAGPDTEPPSVPGTLTATAASSSEVDLAGARRRTRAPWSTTSSAARAAAVPISRCWRRARRPTSRTRRWFGGGGFDVRFRVRAVDAAGNVGWLCECGDGDDAGGPGR